MLAPSAAYAIASQWGSYIHSADPGACFYAFHAGDGRPVSEEHRTQCLAHLDGTVLPEAEDRVKRTFPRRHGKRGHEHWNAVEDLNELRVLRDFLIATPLRESAH
ncbi:hypothetical protein ABID82_005051 [Methylobacterium sp. PvP062]|uniref:DUF222 domain-containing protein n=1 Tax=Methylobacterium radiotolerans TaxID=31998 RepID=A0ABV2NTZ9_9HYPH|nr:MULTISPECIES: hypothetical protein [Methylobacterium]MBP2498365.1 hypothetical protein [Methylobacterium sp. PvP105]MBP2505749.1 hypothetical protein [Methylobacterium sp. PvP109]UIN38370.1 hypothetical protein LXM90_30780 [Methylobacterium oryzae]